MNTAVKRRMRERRVSKGGMPWWAIGLLAIGALASISVAVGLGVVFTVYTTYADEYVPIEEKLSQRFAGLTEVYDRSGPEGDILLGSLPNPDAQLLEPVPLSAISQFMIDATVSTEDNTFWSNPGINFRGLMRAAWENYVGGGIGTGSGGSSITQQLIKNVYLSDDCEIVDGVEYCFAPRTLDRKMREIAFAIELEKDASKEQIMEWYLNQTSYAGRYVGVEAAAQGYFRKSAAELTLAEAALLSGIPQSPSQYHPRLNCEVDAEAKCIEDGLGRTTVGGAAKLRQGDVLDLMVSTGAITESEATAAKAEVLLVYPALDERLASAFIDNQVEPFLVRLCEAGEIPIIAGAEDCEDSLQNAGYKVTTSLDYPETSRAEALVREHIAGGLEIGCNCHNASIVTIDPRNGQLTVYVSNIDPDNTLDEYIQGDIDQATEINQPGSSFKPAVYLAWFEYANKAPYSTFWDTSPLNISGTSIVNPRPGGGGEGLITARAALGGSQNVGAVRAAIEAGPDNVIEMAKKLGITTLAQGFDPTFVAHADITYGASIATGGANIRVVDMAYMQTVFANMGVMVGTPTRTGEPINMDDLKGTFTHQGEEYAEAIAQYNSFNRGDIRLPGTRTLDPIVVLKIEGPNGDVVWEQGEPERIQVVDAGSVWLLQSIMTDCKARRIIWSCGASNDGLGLDFVMADGTLVPAGVKTGTQQGFTSAVDTLETWTTGFTRYAGTAVWVGNANNENVVDGPPGYQAANTTVRLYKTWMGRYHDDLQLVEGWGAPAGFDDLRPANVAQSGLLTPTTEFGSKGGCDQVIVSWVRTDVTYANPCESAEIDTRNGLLAGPNTPSEFRATKKFVILPSVGTEAALQVARQFGIPVRPTQTSSGETLVSIANVSNGQTINKKTTVIGSVSPANLKSWTLEIGAGQNPSSWTALGSGSSSVTNGVLGEFDPATLENGVYTLRITAVDNVAGDLGFQVTFNVSKTEPTPSRTGTPGPGTPSPGPGTPTPEPTETVDPDED